MLGYLTVIPGQLCIFRWEAIVEKTKNNSPHSVLNQYFRGLRNLTPFESTMFLAEDRILGFEIISKEDSRWRLGFEPLSVAVTDSCDSLEELFKQRKRWINSSFTCSLWLIAKIGKYIKNSSAPLFEKLHTLMVAPWLAVNNLFQWLFPSIIVITASAYVAKFGLFAQSWPWLSLVSKVFLNIFIVLLAVQFFMSYFTRFSKKIKYLFVLNGIVSLMPFLSTITYLSLNFHKSIIDTFFFSVILSEPLGLLLIAGFYSKDLFKNFVKIIIQFILLRPYMWLQLSLYSFCNLHNCSWGTKGLDNENMGYNVKKRVGKNRKTQFHKFRFIFVSLWFTSNVSLMLLFFYSGFNEKILTSIILALVVLVGFRLFSGFIFAINSKIYKNSYNLRRVILDIQKWVLKQEYN